MSKFPDANGQKAAFYNERFNYYATLNAQALRKLAAAKGIKNAKQYKKDQLVGKIASVDAIAAAKKTQEAEQSNAKAASAATNEEERQAKDKSYQKAQKFAVFARDAGWTANINRGIGTASVTVKAESGEQVTLTWNDGVYQYESSQYTDGKRKQHKVRNVSAARKIVGQDGLIDLLMKQGKRDAR